MSSELNRRKFIRHSVLTSTVGALATQAGQRTASAKEASKPPVMTQGGSLPVGQIGDLSVSRMLLGGNLLTHFTHSRDLKYVYNLAQHYNTEAKILETLATAEANGVNTLVIHVVPWALKVLREHREKHGGKMQWIICPTAPMDDKAEEYTKQVEELVEMGADALYVWGVRGDQLIKDKRVDLLAKAVTIAKECGVPCGVGAHNLDVIVESEKNEVDADFYIKTLHHHNYPTGPKPEELTKPYSEVPGYWCNNPEKVVQFMSQVDKPWIAFKVMAAGAIPPKDAFTYAFGSGADHIIAGMFDYEIAEDARIAREAMATAATRERPWRS